MKSDEAPDLDGVVPLTENHPPGQNKAFKEARQRAHEYVASHKVSAIEQEYLGACIDGIVYIFLMKVGPTQKDVAPWIWVIVGDIPSACLKSFKNETPYEALRAYIEVMDDWAAAARKGKSVGGLAPVNVPATPENAEMLGSRLRFLEQKILPMLKE